MRIPFRELRLINVSKTKANFTANMADLSVRSTADQHTNLEGVKGHG
jgi:hypothetical protein